MAGYGSARGLMAGACALALSACGGGGGGGGVQSTPAPALPPPVATPSPTPPPPAFDTAEYQRSTGLALANALPAYQAGGSGAGVTVAVIDSGVAAANAEFAGRLSPASTDVVGTRGVGDESGHGTAVSSVLLGARNDVGTHGVAFGATLLALRTDSIGSCTGAQGECSHSDNAIARALDIAVQQGARVANLSLGGDAPNTALRLAMQRATAAGMVLVISAGNDGAAQPDPFAAIATDSVIARNQIIIAGAYDAGRVIAEFSNRAGAASGFYLTALGSRVRAIDETGTSFLYSGTSFSAPHIAGATALLAQAFPNLTGAQIAQILFDSADDLGAAGTDAIYGRGGLNIGRAFAPRGGAALAGTAFSLTGGAALATLSPAMGDAVQRGLSAVMLDGFGRAYGIDLGSGIGVTAPSAMLGPILNQPVRGAGLAQGDAAFGLSLAAGRAGPGDADPAAYPGGRPDAGFARPLAGFVAGRISRRTALAAGFGQSGAALAARLDGHAEQGLLMARAPGDALGFDRRIASALGVSHRLAGLGLSLVAEQGDALRALPGDPRRPLDRAGYALVGLGAGRALGPVAFDARLSVMREAGSVLGGRFGAAFGGGGARTVFGDVGARWSPGPGWSLGAAARLGWTRMDGGGLVAEGAAFGSTAFALDLARTGLFAAGDRLALRVAQPLRVGLAGAGGIAVRLPTGYDYADGSTRFDWRRLNLTPDGREIAVEAGYAGRALGGSFGANLFWRRDPGHFVALGDDMGLVMRWQTGF